VRWLRTGDVAAWLPLPGRLGRILPEEWARASLRRAAGHATGARGEVSNPRVLTFRLPVVIIQAIPTAKSCSTSSRVCVNLTECVGGGCSRAYDDFALDMACHPQMLELHSKMIGSETLRFDHSLLMNRPEARDAERGPRFLQALSKAFSEIFAEIVTEIVAEVLMCSSTCWCVPLTC
jgi:hypothetical protein